MSDLIFLAIVIFCSTAYLLWGVTRLPDERWQVLATVPTMRQGSSGPWHGINLTWYGLLTANAYAAAVAILLALLGAVNVPVLETGGLAVVILAVCVPAASLVARLVEKKSYTFTVGGAAFVGTILAPWAVVYLDRWFRLAGGEPIPVMPALAAIAIAYAFGEGFGRLACISFGCCYGKPLTSCRPSVARIFRRCSFVFTGSTKKIAYADGLDGVRVVPVQALTAFLYVGTGIAGIALYLEEHYAVAFVLASAVTQIWRSFSETLRKDYRGGGAVSAYQIMGLAAALYAAATALLLNAPSTAGIHMADGVATLWQPAVILFLQAIWLGIFLHTGRSRVTGATLSFHVREDRI